MFTLLLAMTVPAGCTLDCPAASFSGPAEVTIDDIGCLLDCPPPPPPPPTGTEPMDWTPSFDFPATSCTTELEPGVWNGCTSIGYMPVTTGCRFMHTGPIDGKERLIDYQQQAALPMGGYSLQWRGTYSGHSDGSPSLRCYSGQPREAPCSSLSYKAQSALSPVNDTLYEAVCDYEADGTVAIYVDGVDDTDATSNGCVWDLNPVTKYGVRLAIGGTNSLAFDGDIEECWVFGGSLTPEQINRVYSCGLSGSLCSCDESDPTQYIDTGRHISGALVPCNSPAP